MRLLLTTLMFVSSVAFAQDAKLNAKAAEALSETYACNECHQLDMKVVGPSLKEIAARYKTDKDAPTKLVEKIKKGGSGAWGQVPMPPNNLKDEDLKTLVAWILSL
ncbi:MAG: c-type cytochrome [Betaproteobacteria bacterium]|nr:c-type cytochrome [Betaproteobacteria bacterium]